MKTFKYLTTLALLAMFASVPITASASPQVTRHYGHRPAHSCRIHHVYQTGPYQLTAGTNLVVDDPCVPRQNAGVQVQNYSGYSLNAQLSGANETIPPYTAVTLSQGGAYQLTIVPAAVLSNFGGKVLLVWLQPGEAPPVADGTLFQGNTNQGGANEASGVTLVTGGAGLILAAPPVGYAYRVHMVTIRVNGAVILATTNIFIYFLGPNVGQFFNTGIATGSIIAGTFLLNGLLVKDSISIDAVVPGGGTPQQISGQVFYDLVQI